MMIVIDGDHNAIELEFRLIEQQQNRQQTDPHIGRAAAIDAACEVGALMPDNIESIDSK